MEEKIKRNGGFCLIYRRYNMYLKTQVKGEKVKHVSIKEKKKEKLEKFTCSAINVIPSWLTIS